MACKMPLEELEPVPGIAVPEVCVQRAGGRTTLRRAMGASSMADVLKIARDKSDRLVREAEETSDLVQSAEFFIKGIQKYRGKIGEDVRDIDGFIASGRLVLRSLQQIRTGSIDEAEKMRSFIRFGEELLRSAAEDGSDSAA